MKRSVLIDRRREQWTYIDSFLVSDNRIGLLRREILVQCSDSSKRTGESVTILNVFAENKDMDRFSAFATYKGMKKFVEKSQVDQIIWSVCQENSNFKIGL